MNIFPEDKDILSEYLNQNYSAGCNNFIMSKNNFFEYCKMLDVEIDISKKMISENNFDSLGNYQKRQLAFITERMFGFWVFKNSRKGMINIVNCPWKPHYI